MECHCDNPVLWVYDWLEMPFNCKCGPQEIITLYDLPCMSHQCHCIDRSEYCSHRDHLVESMDINSD